MNYENDHYLKAKASGLILSEEQILHAYMRAEPPPENPNEVEPDSYYLHFYRDRHVTTHRVISVREPVILTQQYIVAWGGFNENIRWNFGDYADFRKMFRADSDHT